MLDPLDWPLLEGRRVLLVDDVIATGGTVRAAHRLLERAGATVAATAAMLLKGPEPDRAAPGGPGAAAAVIAVQPRQGA